MWTELYNLTEKKWIKETCLSFSIFMRIWQKKTFKSTKKKFNSVFSIFLNTSWKLRGGEALSRFSLYHEDTSAVSTCAVLLFLGMPLLQYVFLDSRRSLTELSYSPAAVGESCTGLWELRGSQRPVRLPVQSPEKSRKISSNINVDSVKERSPVAEGRKGLKKMSEIN